MLSIMTAKGLSSRANGTAVAVGVGSSITGDGLGTAATLGEGTTDAAGEGAGDGPGTERALGLAAGETATEAAGFAASVCGVDVTDVAGPGPGVGEHAISRTSATKRGPSTGSLGAAGTTEPGRIESGTKASRSLRLVAGNRYAAAQRCRMSREERRGTSSRVPPGALGRFDRDGGSR
jgi:hypothetical protein